MKPRYFTRANKPRSFWVEDDTYDDPIRQDTPQVCDHEATDTGLLDARGDTIMRAPNPMGVSLGDRLMNFAAIFRAIGIRGAVAIGLAVALAVVMWRADTLSGQRDALRADLATEEARHAVTRQSVDTLTLEMKRLVAEGEARAERIDEVMMQVAEDTAPLRAEAERIEREGLGQDYAGRLRESGI